MTIYLVFFFILFSLACFFEGGGIFCDDFLLLYDQMLNAVDQFGEDNILYQLNNLDGEDGY